MTRLGFFGLAPFVFGAAVMWTSPLIVPQWAALNIHTLVLSYGGIVAAYMAGAGAGAGLKSHSPASLQGGVIATLAAWFAIWPGGFLTFSVPSVQRYLILIAVYVWILLRDLRAGGDFPSWYGALRTRLTFWACISLILIMARLLSWHNY
ncbi:MAG: DUF3429 family protein [Pseudomonadota bacterium]